MNIFGIWGDGDGGFISSVYDIFLEDGFFVCLSNIILGYNFLRIVLVCIGFCLLRVYVFVDNFYVWMNYIGYDFEVSVGFNQFMFGLDVDFYLRQCIF